MPTDDLRTILLRLQRIVDAVDLGVDAVATRGRGGHDADGDLAEHLVDTAWEAVRLGHVLTRTMAYDEMWGELGVLLAHWAAIDQAVRAVSEVSPLGGEPAALSRSAHDVVAAIDRSARIIDSAQLDITAHPRDRAARGRLAMAIAEMEAAADRWLMDAVAVDRCERSDAALALLTTCAARAHRERTSAAARGR